MGEPNDRLTLVDPDGHRVVLVCSLREPSKVVPIDETERAGFVGRKVGENFVEHLDGKKGKGWKGVFSRSIGDLELLLLQREMNEVSQRQSQKEERDASTDLRPNLFPASQTQTQCPSRKDPDSPTIVPSIDSSLLSSPPSPP